MGGMADDPKWPKFVKITPGKGVELDGVEFPWWITDQGVTVQPGSRLELTTVTITIPCDRIEIVEPPHTPKAAE